MRARLNEADQTIILAEERLHEHNIIDENLAAMLAKVKLHSQHELRRFKEESEISHQNSVSTTKTRADFITKCGMFSYTAWHRHGHSKVQSVPYVFHSRTKTVL